MVVSDKLEIVELLLEALTGVIVTDAENKIIYISNVYANILQVQPAAVLGKPVAEVIPGTRMPIVLKTGHEEIGSLFSLKNGEKVIINRIPIKKGDAVIGVVAFSSLNNRAVLNTEATFAGVKRLIQEINRYKNELSQLRGARYSLNQIIGNSPGIAKVKSHVEKIAQTKSTVLITGETGTGKELVAHAIHQSSPRNHQAFVRINCAAIPMELIESELFGYEEGSFTGAKKGGKLGKFEMANYGTLLLDEINQMPLHLQSKLLRVIQEKELERVGGTKPIDIDVRLICTTNQNLLELVQEGKFREDLYYRVNVATIDIPPLRTRMEDIPLLINSLIAKINNELSINIEGISDAALELLCSYQWPGNVRELEHTIERAANFALSGVLTLEHFENLSLRVVSRNAESMKLSGLSSARAKAEREAIIAVLTQTNWNVAKASQILNIHRTVLYDKLKKYNINLVRQ